MGDGKTHKVMTFAAFDTTDPCTVIMLLAGWSNVTVLKGLTQMGTP